MAPLFIPRPTRQNADSGRIAIRVFLCIALVAVGSAASAQQATTTRDARQAYGSRLDQSAVPEASRGVVHRLDTRVANRINNRLNTRVERYTATVDPVATLRDNPLERTTQPPVVQAPLPPVPE